MELNFVSDLVHVGEVRCIASCSILVVNNNLLKDLPLRFLFVMKSTSFKSTSATIGPRFSQFKLNNLFNEHSLSYFLKVFCRVKTGEVEVNCH